MYGIECDDIDFKEIVADRNLLLGKILVFRNTSTNKKICQGLGVGQNGSHDLLGTRFYLGLMNIFLLVDFVWVAFSVFFFCRYFCMIELVLNFIVKIS